MQPKKYVFMTLFRPAFNMSMGCSAERGRQRRCFSSPPSSLPVKTAQNKRCAPLYLGIAILFSPGGPQLHQKRRFKLESVVDKSEECRQIRAAHPMWRPSWSTVSENGAFRRLLGHLDCFCAIKKSCRLNCAVMTYTRLVFVLSHANYDVVYCYVRVPL